jgi:3',5'-cyclic AMP phosphodiesterase CpdA
MNRLCAIFLYAVLLRGILEAVGQEGELRPPVAGSTTLVILPDTQYYSQKYPHFFEAQTRWIAENATNRNIAYVLHVGDVTENNRVTEWAVARRCFGMLDGKVPYLLVPGNHDYSGGRTNMMSEFFPVSELQKWPTFGGVLDADRLDNNYHLFRIGDQDWIALGLEFGPGRRAIAWADEVLAKHRSRMAIIVTHAYMFYNNERFDYRKDKQRASPHGVGGDGADGQELWDGLVRKHSNVMIVVCGHVATGGLGYRVDEGDCGNTVHQMMCCYQKMEGGGQAYLRLLEFMPDGKTVRVQTYSPATRGVNPRSVPLEDFSFTLQAATRTKPK